MLRSLLFILFAFSTFLSMSSLAADRLKSQYSAYYADLNGDGRLDLLIVPDDVFVPVGVPTTPIMKVSDLPAFVVWGAGQAGAYIELVSPRDYRTRGLPKAKLDFYSIRQEDIKDMVVVFPGEDYNLLVIYDFMNLSGIDLFQADLRVAGSPIGVEDSVGFYDVNGDGYKDLVFGLGGSTVRYSLSGTASGFGSDPQLLAYAAPGSNLRVLPTYEVGATSIDVDASGGELHFSIPFNIAPGGAGVTPAMGLSYSSANGYGNAGSGMFISGQSYVARCSATYRRDGISLEVNGTGRDFACLDGVRLVLVEGAYWGNNSRYRLEIDSQVDITYKKNEVNGSFVARYKDGDVHVYGGSTDSTVVGDYGPNGEGTARWALRRVSDRLGQGYDISYVPGSGASALKQIEYTTGLGAAPIGKIEIEYEQDGFWPTSYVDGTEYESGWRVRSIRNIVNDGLHREYQLFYTVNAVTGRSMLKAVLECAASTACLKPLEIDWESFEAKAYDHQILSYMPVVGPAEAVSSTWVDIDRDGKSNYCAIIGLDDTFRSAGCYVSRDGGVLNHHISINLDVSGPGAFDYTRINESNWNRDPAWIDINNDGYIDLCYTRLDSVSEISLVCHVRSEGGELFAKKVETKFNLPERHGSPPFNAIIRRVVLDSHFTDFNGNGNIDLCFEERMRVSGGISAISENLSCIHGPLLDGDGELQHKMLLRTPGSIHSPMTYQAAWADVNGDGVLDFCRANTTRVQCAANKNFSSGEVTWLSGWSFDLSGELFSPPHQEDGPGYGTSYLSSSYIDINGNGFTDYCRIFRVQNTKRSGYQATCLLSNGYGWGAEVFSEIVLSPVAYAAFFEDINDNGKHEWCLEFDSEIVCRPTNLGKFSGEVISIPLRSFIHQHHVSHIRSFVDLHGYGNDSYCLMPVTQKDGLQPFRYLQCLSSGEGDHAPGGDYIVSIKNGFGLTYEVEYKSTGSGLVYEYDREVGDHGQFFMSGGQRVVSRISVHAGGQHHGSKEFFYRNYGYHNNGLGGVGFEYIKTEYDQGERKNETWFLQDALRHKVGLVAETRLSLYIENSGYQVVSESSNNWGAYIYSGPQNEILSVDNIFNENKNVMLRYATALHDSESSEYELNGELIDSTFSSNEYDEFGNLVYQMTESSASVGSFQEVLQSQYHNDISEWLIGRMVRSSLTKSGVYDGEITPPQTRTTSWEHYSSGILAGMVKREIIEPDHPELRKETLYQYNSYGLPETVTSITPDTGDRAIEYSYEPGARGVSRKRNSLGHEVHYEYDPVSGQRTISIDANGLITYWHHDKFGRVERIVNADGSTLHTSMSLCDESCPEEAVYYTASWSESLAGEVLSAHFLEYVDVKGQIIEERGTGFSGEWVRTLTEYDASGNVARRSEPFRAGESVYWNSVLERDASGRPLIRESAAGKVVSTSYGAHHVLEEVSWPDPQGGGLLSRTSSAAKDVQGNVRVATDGLGNVTRFQYDAFGNLLNVELPDGLIIENQYDLRGRRIYHSDPSMGEYRYAHNGYGQLVVQQNGNGDRICNKYDSLGRLIARTDNYRPDLSWSEARSAALSGCVGQPATTQWLLDDPSKGIGRLAAIIHGDEYSKIYEYDSLGRAVQLQADYDGHTYTEQNVYESGSSRLLLQRFSGKGGVSGVEVENRYNNYGYLEEVGVPGSPIYFWRVEEKDAYGSPIEERLSNGAVRRNHQYSSHDGLLLQARVKRSISSAWDIQNESYEYDALGAMTSRSELLPSLNVEIREDFFYDSIGRLTGNAVSNAARPGLSYSQSVDYSASGNILYKSGVGHYGYGEECASEAGLATPSIHAVTSIAGAKNASYCYDAAGNMISGDGRLISYSVFGKPDEMQVGATVSRFEYDHDRTLVRHVMEKSATGGDKTITRTLFGAYESIETVSGGSYELRERYNIGPVIITVDQADYQNPSEFYPIADALGSMVAALDAFGQVLERHRYDPWGRPRESLDWLALGEVEWLSIDRTELASSSGFTGHQMLDFAGIIHMGGRIYDPAVGRFLSPDPFVVQVDNSQSYNRYSYVMNSPMMYTDPSGYISNPFKGNPLKRLENNFKRYSRQIFAVVNPQAAFTLWAHEKGSQEVARFAARNKYAGQIIGITGMVGCTIGTGAAGAGVCSTVFQGMVTAHISYGSGASIEHALRAGARSAAIAHANAAVAGYIGGLEGVGQYGRAAMHSARGGTFAAIQGGDFRSGAIGAGVEGLLAGYIGEVGKGNHAAEIAVASFISGTVSEATGGKFWVGAHEGAVGYLFNFLSEAAINQARGEHAARFWRRQAEAQAAEALVPDDLALAAAGATQVAGGALMCSTGAGCTAGAAVVAMGVRDIYSSYTSNDMFVRPFVAAGYISESTGTKFTLTIDAGSLAMGGRGVIAASHRLDWRQSIVNAAGIYGAASGLSQ